MVTDRELEAAKAILAAAERGGVESTSTSSPATSRVAKLVPTGAGNSGSGRAQPLSTAPDESLSTSGMNLKNEMQFKDTMIGLDRRISELDQRVSDIVEQIKEIHADITTLSDNQRMLYDQVRNARYSTPVSSVRTSGKIQDEENIDEPVKTVKQKSRMMDLLFSKSKPKKK